MKLLAILLSFFSLPTIVFSQNLTSGLEAHYKFENNGNDETSNNYNFNLGSATFTPFDINDQAVYFDGNQRGDQIGNFNNSNFTQTAVAFWVKAYILNTSQQDQTLIQGAFAGFGVSIRPNTGEVSAFFANSSFSAVHSNTNIVDTTWHHIVAQNNGTTSQIYIDGVLEGSRQQLYSKGNGSASQKRLYLARTNQNVRSFKGALNDLRIYDRALTQVEIDSLYRLKNPYITTSIANNIESEKREFFVYPNPSSESVQLTVNKSFIDDLLIIRNSLGQIVHHERIQATHSIIHLSEMKAGIYFVEISNEKTTSVQKLIKQ